MSLSIIPESAPFNAEQRAWLNGFLAGWLGLQEGGAAADLAAALPAMAGLAPSIPAVDGAPAAAHEDEDFPGTTPPSGSTTG